MTDRLPAWRSALAVVAHPDDESFGLGAVLSTFVEQGTAVSVLCFTRGEASTLQGVDGDLAEIRTRELTAAGHELGVTDVELLGYPDGDLTGVDIETLRDDVVGALDACGADGLIVFDADGVTGHADHRHATEAARSAARPRGLPVLGWTVPTNVASVLNDEFGAAFSGNDPADIDVVVTVDRIRQSRAVACHLSQAVPGSVLWRRLELLADREYLRLLSGTDSQVTGIPPGGSLGIANEGQTA